MKPIRLLFVSLFAGIFFLISCELFQPHSPDKKADVRLHLHYGFPTRNAADDTTQSRAHTISESAPLHKQLSDSAGPYLFDKLSIVFYNLQSESEYHEEYDFHERISAFLEGFQGDSSDFESYWMRRDQGYLDILTGGRFDIELRTVLTLQDGRFYGKYDLSPGLKSYRIGCYKGDSLVAVAPHEESYSAALFLLTPNITFDLHANAIPIDQINNTPPAPIFTVSPDSGSVQTEFQFDASASYDEQDAPEDLLLRWDWRNNGIWTRYSSEKTVFHQFQIPGTYTVVLQIKDTNGVTATAAKTVYVSEAIPRLLLPTEGAELNTATPRFSWSEIENALFYHIRVGFDSTFTEIIINDSLITNTAYTPEETLSDSHYYWQVRAQTDDGAWSGWSEIRSFQISAAGPAAPQPQSPDNGSAFNDAQPIFLWSAVDAATRYHIQISYSDDLLAAEDSSVLNPEYSLDTPLDEALYFWRVRAQDAHARWGSWSTTFTFTIDKTAPAVPIPNQPEAGGVLTTLFVSFSWSAETDAVSFDLQVDYSEAFTAPVISDSMISAQTWENTTPFSDGLYAWRVRARDAAGNISSWSNAQFFTIDTQGPAAPELDQPMDNAEIGIPTPQLSWFTAEGALRYELIVDNDQSFTSPIVHDSSMTVTSVILNTELEDSRYWWKVRARDEYGNVGSWSVTRTFTINTAGPAAPDLLQPEDGFITDIASLELSWTPVTDAAEYIIQLAYSPDFINPVVEDSLTDSFFYTEDVRLSDSTYYWRVQAQDILGNRGVWSEPRSFTQVANQPYLRLQLQTATVNDQQIQGAAAEFRVNPGEELAGTFTVYFEHNLPVTDIIPLAATPNRGNRETGYWLAQDYVMNELSYQGQLSLTAPSLPGTYYIILAASPEETAGQIVSATHSTYGSLVWDDGNDVYDLSDSQILRAIETGTLPIAVLTRENPLYVRYGLTAITIIVQ
ncbi:MAG: PKD domain-containing protein [candidate division KSB1 bacterium]|nr:PKD domain-containing protein [candidate division KSB1 bacterium]